MFVTSNSNDPAFDEYKLFGKSVWLNSVEKSCDQLDVPEN
jgi:hypothetical protein